MKLVVTSENRFLLGPDGRTWTKSQFQYAFWARYLEVYEEVLVLARVEVGEAVPRGWSIADGARVSFLPVPYYKGPLQFICSAKSVVGACRAAASKGDAFILRSPSHISALLRVKLQRARRPYGVEVVGDPGDVFGPDGVRHPLRRIFRGWFVSQLQQDIKFACGVAYVTRSVLQRRYPCKSHSWGVSDVELPSEAILVSGRAISTWYSSVDIRSSDLGRARSSFQTSNGLPQLITVGTLEQLYKAPDIAIRAVHLCSSKGRPVRLRILGDGKYRQWLVQLASELGVSDKVEFLGEISDRRQYLDYLDGATLFVLPSRTEGLPRAMIEAMARGLPCIGSRIGGIPELLEEENLFRANDAEDLASKVIEVLSSDERMIEMSKTNIDRALEYRDELLRTRRVAFYRWVRERSEEYRTKRHRCCEKKGATR